jgi:hypothetical protein
MSDEQLRPGSRIAFGTEDEIEQGVRDVVQAERIKELEAAELRHGQPTLTDARSADLGSSHRGFVRGRPVFQSRWRILSTKTAMAV